MNIIEIYKSRKTISELFKQRIIDKVSAYADTEDGKWINDIDLHKVEFYWSSALKGTTILGAKLIFCKNKIFLQNKKRANVDYLIPTIVHELRHIWQVQSWGTVKYTLLSIPELIPCLYGKFPVEQDAQQETIKIKHFLNNKESE